MLLGGWFILKHKVGDAKTAVSHFLVFLLSIILSVLFLDITGPHTKFNSVLLVNFALYFIASVKLNDKSLCWTIWLDVCTILESDKSL